MATPTTQDKTDAYRQAVALKPDVPDSHYKLGMALREKGQLDEAIDAFRRAITLNPDYADAHADLGIALKDKGLHGDAIAAFRRVVALRPDSAGAHNNLGLALGEARQFDEALAELRKVVGLRPALPEAHRNLGIALMDSGQVDEAIAENRQAIALRPDYIEAHDSLLYLLHFHPAYDAEAIAEEHRAWNRRYADPLKKLIKAYANNRNPDRPLRVGYVSSGLRHHPVGRFLLPLFQHHDRGQFETFCYSDGGIADGVTERLRSKAGCWRETLRLSDDALASQVRDDRIDILVDLGGHTSRNRLLVFARKPAPVQVSYLGYPGTTGLSTIDYRLTDNFADPPGMGDRFHSEKLLRLPQTNWCFGELQASGPVTPPPAIRRGYVTFGSFNILAKVTETMLQAWGRILQEVPGSRLLLKASALGSECARQRVRRVFTTQGIDIRRLELHGLVPEHTSHLDLYREMDIALDTFPYHGTTTTCEALSMGVPVVTLAGQTHVSRVGVSLLSNVGLADLVTNTIDEYVGRSVTLANDLDRLTSLRLGLGRRMAGSPLMDAPSFARNIEAAYRQMWRNWCENR